MEKKNLIIPWISLFCLLMGMLFSFCSAFGCQIRTGRHIFPTILIAGIVLFFIVQLKRKYAVLFSVAGGLLLTIFGVVNFASLEREFQIFLYYINNKSMAYNGKLLLNYPSTHGAFHAMDSNTLLRIFGIFFAVFISFFLFRLHSRTYGMTPVYLVVALGLLVGNAPDGKAVSFLAVGTVLAYSWVARQEKGGKHFFVQKRVRRKMGVLPVYLVLTTILILGLVIAKLAGIRQEDKILSHSDEYLNRQHKMEMEVKRAINRGTQLIRGRIGVDSTGEMTNEAPRYKYQTVMRMTVPYKPTSSFFLRGFVGGSYQNGKWSPCETEKLHKQVTMDNVDISIWNSSYDFLDYYITRENVDSVLKGYQRRKMTVSLEYVGRGKWGNYAYVPYFSDITSLENARKENCISLDGENGFLKDENFYRLNCYNIGEYNYNDITEQVRRSYQEFEVTYGQETVLEQEAVNTMALSWYYRDKYIAYISENYAKIPDGTVRKLKEFMDGYRITSGNGSVASEVNIWRESLAAALVIQMILEQQAEYSLDLPGLPAGEDYAEYFLLESKKGYCEHFATAGTLMLRAKKIAARYVSGFKVTPDMFQENEDGSYTAEILDSDAHAWTEVFVGENAGWYPVDMTPGGSQTGGNIEGTGLPTPTPTPTPTPVKNTEKPKATKPAPTKKPTATPKPTEKAKQNVNQNDKLLMGKNNTIVQAAIVAGSIMFICLFAFAGRILYLRFQAVKYRRELLYNRRNRNEYIKIRVEYFLYFLKLCGMRNIDKMHENDWCRRVAYACVAIYPSDAWDEFKQTVQKAAFAMEEVGEEEFEAFCERILAAEQHIWSKQGKHRKRILWLAGLKKS